MFGKGKVQAGQIAQTVVSLEDEQKSNELAAELLDLCQAPKRDVPAIDAKVATLKSLSQATSHQQKALIKDWRLVFVSNDAMLGTLGTNLHKLPLTRMEDLFVSFKKNKAQGRTIETIEVLRVLGPFPNLRNTLYGTYEAQSPNSLTIKYSSFVDGTGKEITSGTAATDQAVSIKVVFVGSELLIFEAKPQQLMVFAQETDLTDALSALRV